jgi:hypothetical protein
VVVFSKNADDNVAKVIKAIDEVQKSNAKLGTVMVGISGVVAADLEKLQETHKFTTPLTIAQDKDGPKAWGLNKDAAVTVVVYPGKGGAKGSTAVFGFSDTKSAAAKASDIASAAKKALGQ